MKDSIFSSNTASISKQKIPLGSITVFRYHASQGAPQQCVEARHSRVYRYERAFPADVCWRRSQQTLLDSRLPVGFDKLVRGKSVLKISHWTAEMQQVLLISAYPQHLLVQSSKCSTFSLGQGAPHPTHKWHFCARDLGFYRLSLVRGVLHLYRAWCRSAPR